MSSIEPVSARRAPGRRFPCFARMALASSLVAIAAGCSWGAGEEERPDTVVMLTVIAMDDVNPNFADVPSPIVVVFYELAEPQAFESAEFNQLFYDDGSTLGTDVKARLELRVEPGEIITTSRVLDPGTRHLGFVAGYREIEGAKWRILADVAPASTGSRTLVVGARSLSLPDVAPTRVEDSAYDDSSGGVLDGLTDTLKGVVDAVLPGSE